MGNLGPDELFLSLPCSLSEGVMKEKEIERELVKTIEKSPTPWIPPAKIN